MRAACIWAAAAGMACAAAGMARGDLVLRSDGTIVEGKITSRDASGLTVQPDVPASAPAIRLPAAAVREVIVVDEHGAELMEAQGTGTPAQRNDPEWKIPREPAAPAVNPPPEGPSYYLIPLHGAVGETVNADALDKSLADAQKRKPTVVVLDIESPGGSVGDAQDMIKVLHRYNKEMRIVALAGEDFSAAAIATLSVHEIYMKPTGTIGAATAYDASNPTMPADISEKMQSAWRAIARSSAEEGGHDPLLADAMINSGMDLHLETGADGKKVVREGIGKEMLVRRGQILTLTGSEAENCGLAAGEAEDLADLGVQLKLKGWREIPGLGTMRADYLPQRWEAYQKQTSDLEAGFKESLNEALHDEPTDNVMLERVVTGPATPQPGFGQQRIGVPRGPAPGRPGLGGGGIGRGGGFGGGGGGFGAGGLGGGLVQQQPRIVTEAVRMDSPQTRARWQGQSLATVVAIQKMERNVADQISLAKAFGEETDADQFKDLLGDIASLRAQVYGDRNKYISVSDGGAADARGGPAPATPGAGFGGRAGSGFGSSVPPYTPVSSGDSTAAGDAGKTDQLGGKGGWPFTRGDADNRPMIGVQYTMGSWAGKPVVRRIDPLYEKPGGDAGEKITVMAREGYVVGGMNVVSDDNIDAFQVQFVRLRNGRPDPSDSYQSDWQGAPGDHAQARKLAGNGEKVVGIFGRRGLNQDAMGLLIVPAESR